MFFREIHGQIEERNTKQECESADSSKFIEKSQSCYAFHLFLPILQG